MKPNGQNEKYKEIKSKINAIKRDEKVLHNKKRTLEKLLKTFITCEFCGKHFKRVKSNLSKIAVRTKEVRTEYKSSACEFDDDSWEENEYLITYVPYICPYCEKLQTQKPHVEDYFIMFLRKID